MDGSALEDGFVYLPSPGHSIDHSCIGVVSQGEFALYWGDIMHSPLQFAHPEWNSVYCGFPETARTSSMGDGACGGKQRPCADYTFRRLVRRTSVPPG